MLSMIRHPFPSVHNREHGFSKRFNPAGVHNLNPHVTTVSISHLLPFTWVTGGGVIAYNLYLTSTYSMSHAKRSKPTIVRRPFSDVEPFVV